jgi:hypothetical protein
MYYYDNKGQPVGQSAAQAPNIAIPGAGTGASGNSDDSSNAASSDSSNGEDTAIGASGSVDDSSSDETSDAAE